LHYDAMVIGAGPAGCVAARELGDAGFKVLVVERERLPREKPCGGFIPPEAVRLIEERFGPIPGRCLDSPHPIRGARLLCEGGGDYELPFAEPGMLVRRSLLDAWLASSCGAELREGCELLDFDLKRFHVRARLGGEEGEWEAESTYLVGADGANSLVLRGLRPEFHRLYAARALQRAMLVFLEGEMDWDPHWMGMALLKRGRGIARFFLKGGLIGMTVVHDPGSGWQGELDRLLSFLERKAGLRRRGEAARMAAISNRMGAHGHYNLGAGCALLAGEAAGLLDPWGFGVHLAVESGRIAAESLIESAGESITPHVRYRYRMQDLLEEELRRRRKWGDRTGCLETSSLAGDAGQAGRGDRRALHRLFAR
jgi:flavin-dependent dehydrogenase